MKHVTLPNTVVYRMMVLRRGLGISLPILGVLGACSPPFPPGDFYIALGQKFVKGLFIAAKARQSTFTFHHPCPHSIQGNSLNFRIPVVDNVLLITDGVVC